MESQFAGSCSCGEVRYTVDGSFEARVVGIWLFVQADVVASPGLIRLLDDHGSLDTQRHN
jgi:hypothetical protein